MKQFIFKTLRVIYNFQPMLNYYPYATTWKIIKWKMARSVRNVSIVASFVIVGGASALTWNKLHPVTVWAEKTIEVPIEKGIPPIMSRIAKCESGGVHIDPKTGQVIMRSNTNGSVDVGKFQINSIWFKKASDLGLDITKELDNEKMAMWIYENKGTTDWSASQTCWYK